jgi:plasmid stabilization system protein ParE
MRVRYTPLAERHMRGIAAYLRTQSPVGMRAVMRRIRETTELLVQFPEIGHTGALAGTREIVVPGLPYIIVHRIDSDAVTIVGVYHGAQIRPGQAVPDDDS